MRERGATPILITSMERKNGIEQNTLAGYPDAVRGRGRSDSSAPLVDLHAMSQELYRGLGDDLDAAFQDGTHHTDFGSYELARCVVEGIRTAAPELAAHLAADAGAFDPAHPDSPQRLDRLIRIVSRGIARRGPILRDVRGALSRLAHRCSAQRGFFLKRDFRQSC